MRAALALARRGLGRTAPNPTVGCIIIKDEKVVGRGWTQPGGRPHAETMALAQAGSEAGGATAYVSLEPCAHHGQTPPCAQALIDAKVTRVVTALTDPDPRVSGRGLDMLKAAGIEVRSGVCADEARIVNSGFITRITKGRSFVTAKVATTLDGCVATSSGESKWITGERARAHGHMERALHDAIIVGAETYRADQPSLDCRLPGMTDRSPQKFIVKGRKSLHAPEDFTIIEGGDDWPQPSQILEQLAAKGFGRVLIEGGPTLISSFLKHDLVDRLLWYRAPMVFGADGKQVIQAIGIEHIAAAPRFKLAAQAKLGQDSVEIFERKEKESA